MKLALIAAAAVLAATPVLAGGLVAMQRPETGANHRLKVSSPAFEPGGPIPLKYSAFGENVSPPLNWSLSSAAKSYAILVDDPDGKGTSPVSHWVAWNIPATMTMAAEGSKAGEQGTNSHGSVGYTGPHPPAGDAAHHYHFQLLALDRMLSLPAGANREALLAAVKGHVLAKGDLVGTFQAPKP
jgi:Raf kinase inhibitor-like YbhB/YbcL family protein